MASSSVARAGGSREPIQNKMEKFTFTLGKLDAGMAILLGPHAHLLEFPSLLLPTPSPGTPPLGPGSILTITVTRDLEAEAVAENSFLTLQQDILDTYTLPPSAPKLKVRSVTQTSVVLDWDKLSIGSADFRALEMWKNGQRLGRVGGEYGKGKEKREWKTGGLQVGEEFSFHLVLKTTAGTLTSNKIKVKTHTMDNLTGLNIYFGPIQPESLLQQLRSCLSEIGAKESSKLGIDTTHFVCTTPLVGGDDQGRGGAVSREYVEAVQANLPVVGPGWLMAVAGERKLVPISSHLLPPMPTNVPIADPAPFKRPEPLKRASLPFTSSAPGSPISEQPPRSPSPETIARMSYTSGISSRPASRSNSLDTSERHRSMPAEPSNERRRSREATYPLDAPRPKSPKPEADGKLDRGFVFPVSPTSPNGPSSAGTDIQTSISSVGTADVLAKAPGSENTQAESGSGSAPNTGRSVISENDESAHSGGAIPIDIPASAPISVKSDGPPSSAPTQPQPSAPRASTIDEAISNFHEAVTTPQAPSSPEPPLTPTISLNGTPLEDGLEKVDLALSREQEDTGSSAKADEVGDLADGMEAVDLGEPDVPANGASKESGNGVDESATPSEVSRATTPMVEEEGNGKPKEGDAKEKVEVKPTAGGGGGKGGKKGKGKRGGKGGR